MSLRIKILLSFGVLVAFVFFSLTLLYSLLTDFRLSWGNLEDRTLLMLEELSGLQTAGQKILIHTTHIETLKHLSQHLPEGLAESGVESVGQSLDEEIQALSVTRDAIKTRLTGYQNLVERFFPEETHLLEEIRLQVDNLLSTAQTVVELDEAEVDESQFYRLRNHLYQLEGKFGQAIRQALQQEFREVDESSALLDKNLSQLRYQGWLIGMVLICMLLIISLYFLRGIVKSILQIDTASRQIAQGEFDVKVPRDRPDELGRLARTIEYMADQRRAAEEALKTAKEDLEEKNQELDRLSKIDHLTGLNNRLYVESQLMNEIEKAVRYKRPFSLMLMDLDRFKTINDEFGHNVGDVVLRELAGILLGRTRVTDVVGRWGGEEFIVLCPETALEHSRWLGEHLRRLVERHSFSTVGPSLTISIGIAQYQNGESYHQLINRADKALYQAKNQGRNRVCQINGVNNAS